VGGALLACVLLGAVFAAPLAAQQAADGSSRDEDDGPSLFLVDSETRISSLGWSFPSGSALETSRLEENIAVTGPGTLSWVKGVFDFVPFVPSPSHARFSPVVLQRDVVRLRRLYRSAGFPDAEVDYGVALDTTTNRVEITMIVDQKEPIIVDSVSVRVVEADVAAVSDSSEASVAGSTPDASALVPSDASRAERVEAEAAPPGPEIDLPEELREAWASFQRRLHGSRGERFSQGERARLVQETTDWFLERGYPWARTSVARVDTTGTEVFVGLRAAPGSRARVGEIRIEGDERLSRSVLAREIPIRVGDWYDASRISEGERELYELDLVRQALGDIVDGTARDTTVTVRFRIDEGLPRLIWGRVGWRSESGMGGEAHWQHRDLFGGARAFTVSTNFESGWAALEETKTRSVGLSALVRQPYLFQRTMAGTFGPFVRYRDDFRDRSLLFGVETSLIYRKRALEAVTLQHELSRLRVDDTYQLTPIRQVVEQGDSVFSPIFVKSLFTLTGAYGTLDDRINPGSGYLIEPNVAVTGPSGVSDVEYARMGLRAMAVHPLGRHLSFFVRGTAGRLFPFGESDPATGVSRTRALVGLRDAMFTAGGTSDVRGWGNGLMGSKIPDVGVTDAGVVVADRYVPAGGLARLTGTVELLLSLVYALIGANVLQHCLPEVGKVHGTDCVQLSPEQPR